MKSLVFIMACFCALPSAVLAQTPQSSAGQSGVGSGQSASPARMARPTGRARRDADKLISTLKTASQARVRAQAALALRGFPDDPAVTNALMDALGDSNVMVRTSAARALSEIAPASGFARICEIGLGETEPFALIWIRRAAARAAGGAAEIMLSVGSIGCEGGYRPGESGQHVQSGFLKHLLEAGGYAIGSSLDFTDAGKAGPSAAVELTFSGTARVQGDGSSAGAVLEIRAVAPNGFVVWQSTVEVDSVGRGPSSHVPDRFDDEFTIRDDGLDARFMAAFEAGRKAAIIFDDDIRGSGDSLEDDEDDAENE